MSNVIQLFPPKTVRGRSLYTECAASGGEIMLVIGEAEYWLSADEFADILNDWTEALGDALSQLGASVK